MQKIIKMLESDITGRVVYFLLGASTTACIIFNFVM